MSQHNDNERHGLNMQLALLRDNLARGAYPGYPEQAERFTLETIRECGQTALDCLVIPDGSWTVDWHSNRRPSDTEVVPSGAQQNQLLQAGLRLDKRGRPIHPWLEPMLADSTIGLVSGKGAYWNWGPNPTADAIVICDEQLLLIQRGDTGRRALPGGFRNDQELGRVAAQREANEETNITLEDSSFVAEVYDGIIVDPRVTAHAWPETTAVLFTPPTCEQPHGGDDAKDAQWFPLSAVDEQQLLFGSHRLLLQCALNRLAER